MPNPKGNPGNKGGGRKSAHQEMADAEKLFAAFFDTHDIKKLRAKIKSGKYSVFDQAILKAMEANERLLQGRQFRDSRARSLISCTYRLDGSCRSSIAGVFGALVRPGICLTYLVLRANVAS